MAQRFVTAQRLRTRALRLAGSLFPGPGREFWRSHVYLTGFRRAAKGLAGAKGDMEE